MSFITLTTNNLGNTLMVNVHKIFVEVDCDGLVYVKQEGMPAVIAVKESYEYVLERLAYALGHRGVF